MAMTTSQTYDLRGFSPAHCTFKTNSQFHVPNLGQHIMKSLCNTQGRLPYWQPGKLEKPYFYSKQFNKTFQSVLFVITFDLCNSSMLNFIE